MRLILLLTTLLSLPSFVHAIEDPTATSPPTSRMPLGSRQAAIFSCATEDRPRVLFNQLPENNQHGGYEQLLIACEHFLGADSPLGARGEWTVVGITRFSCVATGERAYPLYTSDMKKINVVCLPAEQGKQDKNETVVRAWAFPVPLVSVRNIRSTLTGFRHIPQDLVYTVRCGMNETLNSFREQHKGRWYRHVSCLTNENQVTHERLIACQRSDILIPQTVITPDDNVVHYICLETPTTN